MWKDSGKTNISILHSNLGDRRRYEEWNRIKRGDARIVIGTRSGIFAPIENVGVIVIDEEHDMSYQSDNIRKYDAKEIARYIAKTYGSLLILGSATPIITTYYRANNRNNRNE